MFGRTFAGARAHTWQTAIAVALALTCAVADATAQSAPMTLDEALKRAIAADFALPAARARVRGAEAGVWQAGRPPNPSAGVEVENVAGSGRYRGLDRAETTFFLQQTIELGDKRAARTGVARSEVGATRARGAVRVLDLLRDVELAWGEAVAAEAQLRIAERRLETARELQGEITRRSEAGRDPLFARTRADAQVALEQIGFDQAQATARIARANLAGYWRGSPDFTVDLTAFENPPVRPDGKAFSVDVALLEAERELAAARVVLERSKAVPDPAVRVGVRHFNETSDTAIVGGVSIPLPLFDSNQGGIAKAEAERKAAELDARSARNTLRRELLRLDARLTASAAEAKRIQSEVIPRAEETTRMIRSGLERGAFSYIEFNDAQRTLNEARLRRIEALKTFHQDNAALGRLTGRHMQLNFKKAVKR